MLTMQAVPEHERRRLFDMAEVYVKEIMPRTRVGEDAAHRARYLEGRFPSNKPGVSLWWAKEAGSVVGFAAVEVGTDEVGEVHGFVRDFYIEPSCRRQGYGRSFAQMLLDWMRGKGANRVYLHVRVDSPTASAFWSQVGFETVLYRMRKALR